MPCSGQFHAMFWSVPATSIYRMPHTYSWLYNVVHERLTGIAPKGSAGSVIGDGFLRLTEGSEREEVEQDRKLQEEGSAKLSAFNV